MCLFVCCCYCCMYVEENKLKVMLKVKRSRKFFLEGWEFIEFIIDELDVKM